MLANSSNPVHMLHPGQDLPHLAGVIASLPQLFATRFPRQFSQMSEIGSREPQSEPLFSLIDNAKVVMIECPPIPEHAGSQVSPVVSRPYSSIPTTVELEPHVPEFAGTPRSDRRVFVLDPVARS